MKHDYKFPDTIPPAVATFLSTVDEVTFDEKVPRLATKLKKGRLTLVIGKTYPLVSEAAQVEMLRHHVAHFVLMHAERREFRDPKVWEVVCDAALHETGCSDHTVIEQELDRIKMLDDTNYSATFERLDIPPMPPEMAYELIPVMEVEMVSTCGSQNQDESDGSDESFFTQAIAAMRIHKADPDFVNGISRQAGMDQGSGREVPELTPPPPWIRGTIAYLTQTYQRRDRGRSWMREHRNLPGVIPGRSRAYGKKARIMIDASGSIGTELVTMFLSAVCGTPELSMSDVVVFDSGWDAPIPATNVKAIVEEIARRGGGTAIAAAGNAMRESGTATVWLTDGYTGDGWPDHHNAAEVWCIYGDGPAPTGATVIRIPTS